MTAPNPTLAVHPVNSSNLATLTSPLAPPIPKRPGQRLSWGQLHGSALGLTLANAARSCSAPLVVVTEDTTSATRLAQDLRFYLGRGSNATDLPVLNFPDWETLPYDVFSPHQDIISERLAALHRLPSLTRGILLVPVATLMQRLPPREYLDASTLLLDVGQRLNREGLRARLEVAGYRAVATVMERGEFAVRGGLFDLYPMGAELPYRIDLCDDEVDSIRTFDPENQRSRESIKSIRLLPAREFPFDEAAISRFREAWRRAFDGDTGSPVYRDVTRGLASAGIEYYLPLFFARTATLFDYLPPSGVVIGAAGLEGAADAFWREVGTRYESARHDRERPLLPPGVLYLQTHEVFAGLNTHPRVTFHHDPQEPQAGTTNFATEPPPELPIEARVTRPLGRLLDFLGEFSGRVLIVAETTGRREALLEVLHGANLRPVSVKDWQEFLGSEVPLAITIAPLEQGLCLTRLLQEGLPPLAVVAEHQLFGEQAMQRRRRDRERKGRDAEAVIRDLTELHIGAPVVHEAHGVGRYLGLQRLAVDGVDTEFLTLEYAGGDKLYVPVAALHLVGRYTGMDPEHAPLHKLGSGQWEKARSRAAERARDVAAELLDLYARRAARAGHSFTVEHEQYLAFAAGFPFETTPDQQDAIDATLKDLAAGRPMDRVVCGDVGFGKTEVALRAAFVAVLSGRQVALLVPTTLLAQQHYQTFIDRFAEWPVRIEVMSRFRTKKQQDEVLAGLAAGSVDIVIATHKLLQADIVFKNLGLAIIDEEHRFGVRQKEALKSLRTSVDLLTLTATPIPRTLNMAVSGLREISIIATPPARRLAIQTFVRTWDNTLLREAMLREIKRGGQVYFLHNEVDTIDKMARMVEELLPEATVQVAHGQMRERDLERVMLDFYHQRFNVLVCSTIIETGIDVPSANTIIIHRADRLGLAQLYQLRGRVGRSHHRAYAYLIVPEKKSMTPDAIKRLDAIESLEDLGVGFTLATHDMEIRGAGELLGEEQSGQMQEVGFTLYQELLTRAVNALKSGRRPELERPLEQNSEVDLHLPALIPEDYLADVHTRLILYKRIANATTEGELRELQVEMIDRFGLLPEPVQILFRTTELKLLARPLGIRKIELGPTGGRLLFHPEPAIDPGAVLKLIQVQPQIYRLDGQDKLRVTAVLPDTVSRLAAAEYLIAVLAPPSSRKTPLVPPPALAEIPKPAAEVRPGRTKTPGRVGAGGQMGTRPSGRGGGWGR
ncbi:transcription-repair coupling factor [Gammaproteobacteria bacterium]